MYITDEQFNKLKTLAKEAIAYQESGVVNNIGNYLSDLLSEIYKEPKICALCKKDPNGA